MGKRISLRGFPRHMPDRFAYMQIKCRMRKEGCEQFSDLAKSLEKSRKTLSVTVELQLMIIFVID